MIRITGWGGNLTSTTFFNNSSHGNVAYAFQSEITSTPDPPSGNPTNSAWSGKTKMWIAVVASDTSRTVSVYPYTDNQNSFESGGAGGATLAYCTTVNSNSSENPGTFTISSSDDVVSGVIGILAGVPSVTYSVDALIQKRFTKTQSLDSDILKTLSKTNSLDSAFVVKKRTNTFEGGTSPNAITIGNSGGSSGNSFQKIIE